MNLSLEHIAIPATNPVALKKWYERVLDARLIWDNGQNPPVCLDSIPGGAWLEIYATDLPLPSRQQQTAGFRHLALRVDSLDAMKAELSRRGVRFDDEIRRRPAVAEFCFSMIAKATAAFSRAAKRLAAWQSVIHRRSAESAGLNDYSCRWRCPCRSRCLSKHGERLLADMVFIPSASKWASVRNAERLEELDHNLMPRGVFLQRPGRLRWSKMERYGWALTNPTRRRRWMARLTVTCVTPRRRARSVTRASPVVAMSSESTPRSPIKPSSVSHMRRDGKQGRKISDCSRIHPRK